MHYVGRSHTEMHIARKIFRMPGGMFTGWPIMNVEATVYGLPVDDIVKKNERRKIPLNKFFVL